MAITFSKDARTLVNVLPGRFVILAAHDPRYTVAAATEEYARAMGVTPETLIGKPLFDALPENPEDQHASTEKIANLFRRVTATATAERLPDVKYDVQSEEGYQLRYWNVLVSPLCDQRGKVRHLVYMVDDITDRVHLSRRQSTKEIREVNEELEVRVKERTAQLELLNASLERSNRELQDFAYVASHDLQEPLRKIQAFGNLLQEEYASQLGEEGSSYLDRMRHAAARMSILIEDLLAFSRVTTQAQPFATVDLGIIVSEVLSDLETLTADTRAEIRLGKLPKLKADPLQMRQLFQNIIANALKFHRKDETPVVTIKAAAIPGKGGKIKAYRISIKDNGIGFDEKYIDRIFAVFQRLHGHDTYRGTGIGLAVCRKIVERHSGTITAKSKVGSGSTFIVTLPLNPAKGGVT